MNKVNFFLAGCQKTGSTWLYECFKEHPEICVPTKDAIHYFTINHFEGLEWYNKWFEPKPSEKIICDTTPSYIRDPYTAQRIYDYNPEAKLLFVLRNPIERSFSHYWHQKRKGKVNYNFDAPLHYNDVGNYDMYNMWINSSMYYSQLKSYFEIFNNNQLKVLLFDDLKEDSNKFLEEIFQFMGVESAFIPTAINGKINNAPLDTLKTTKMQFNFTSALLEKLISPTKQKKIPNEYMVGIPTEYRQKLVHIFKQDICNLSNLINRNLSHWK